LEIQAVTL
jgi:hypothetical protein